MGMDVHGKSGAYFRNNVWWWRPLADYVCTVAPEITNKCKYWHSNDGDGLNAEDSIRLANVLEDHVRSGRTMEYAAEYAISLSNIPDETCDLCQGTGVRTDLIVSGGRCNGCDGSGRRKPLAKWYPFSEENVKEFAKFLRESGGFEIW